MTVSNKRLFCLSCREEIAVKKSVIELHIKSKKHVRDKKQLVLKEKRERDIAKARQKYNSEVHPSGETLPDSTRVYRVKVVTALQYASVRLNKVDSFRDLLQEHAYALSCYTLSLLTVHFAT